MLPTKRDVRRQEALRRSVPATCSLLASCLAAGAPPRRALRDVARVVGAPAGPELTTVVQRIDRYNRWAGYAYPTITPVGTTAVVGNYDTDGKSLTDAINACLAK